MLVIFFGYFGEHRFYVGKRKRGLVYPALVESFITVPIIRVFGTIVAWYIYVFTFIFIEVAILCDLYAMYSDLFLDIKGKMLLSGSRQDETVGRTLKEKEMNRINIAITIISFVAFVVMYRVIIYTIEYLVK